MSTKICVSCPGAFKGACRSVFLGRGALSQGNATVSDVDIEIMEKSNSI